MMKRFGFAAALSILVLTFSFAHDAMWDLRSSRSQEFHAGYVPPAPFVRLFSFGYEGIVSNQLFLKLITYCGDHILSGRALDEAGWDYFQQAADVVTDLDPYFQDPYFLTQGFLTWEARRFDEANAILKKGAAHRTWDWRFPFFIGFNYYYFLNDYHNGAEWIMKAAEIPGSPPFLPTLASRLSYYGGEPRTAIAFLREFRAQVAAPSLHASIDRRIRAFEIADQLETAIAAFKDRFGRHPGTGELVKYGFLDEIPPDPYGGNWIINSDGRVFSTSRFTDAPPER